MNSLTIAAIALCGILASVLVIVLVVMKRGNSGSNANQNNKAPNLNNRVEVPQRQMNAGQPPAPNPNAGRNSVMIAQSLIDQLRYDEAEEELKKGMRMQPNDTNIPLKLLNLYAITNNSDKFNSLFAVILDKGHTSTIKEAEQIKSILDAEKAATNPVVENTVQEPQVESNDNSLDFDAFLNETKAQDTITADNVIEENSISLEPTIENPLESPNLNDDSISGLSIEDSTDTFDIIEDDSDVLNSSIDLNLESSVLEMEENSTQGLSSDSNTDNTFDELSLDFNPSLEENQSDLISITEETVAESSKTENNIDNINDFSLESFNIEQDSLTEAAIESNELMATIDSTEVSDFSLDVFEDVIEDNPVATPEMNLTSNEERVSKDFTTEKATPSTKIGDNTQAITEVDSMFDLEIEPDFEVHSDSQEASVIEELEISDLSLDNDFSIESPTPVIEEELNIEELSFEEPTKQNVEQPVQTAEVPTDIPESITPSAPVDLSSEFAFINEIDQNQVTLDLASQYLDLGEYDSAKRLINEVLVNGNDVQKERAQALLAHAG